MSSLLCHLCGQRNDSTGHTCWVQTIAPTALNNHMDARTDSTTVIRALEQRVAALEKVAEAAEVSFTQHAGRVTGALGKALKAAGYLV